MGTMVRRHKNQTAPLGVVAVFFLAAAGCAGPFNQVTPCLINCAVTLNGSPATAPVPVTTAVIPEPIVRVRR